jgi:hypothetical protein
MLAMLPTPSSQSAWACPIIAMPSSCLSMKKKIYYTSINLSILDA